MIPKLPADLRWHPRANFRHAIMPPALRNVLTLGFAVSACWAAPVAAVGLGQVTLQSSLGQSLRVVVPVQLSPGEDTAAECFKLAAGNRDADGIPQVNFGRVSLERTASGAQLVVTNARAVHDPVLRLTLQAGCETAVRREYVLLMDPPPIETPLVAADSRPSAEVAAEPPSPSPAAAVPSRAARNAARDGATGVSRGSAEATRPPGKTAAPKARAATRSAPKRSPAAADQPRLKVSGGAPLSALSAGAKVTAEQERAQQELANAIEAETIVLRQRIVELTALVERMQQEVRASEIAQSEAEKLAKAPSPIAQKTSTPAVAPAWWETNWPVLGAIVGLPLLLAAGLLWKRRRDAAPDGAWPPEKPVTATGAPSEQPYAPALQNPTAGLAGPAGGPDAFPSPARKTPRRTPAARDGANALAVSELLHVTEEAHVYVALGHPERAVDVLNEHVHQVPRSMPAAWLMLLDLYHAGGRRQDFRQLAEEFHLQRNVQAPQWESFGANDSGDGGLETFPHVLRQVVDVWRRPECREYLEGLLFDNREGRRIGFPLAAYGEILLLLQILDAPPPIDIDSDLAGHGKLDPRPQRAATAAPGASPAAESPQRPRPMPPDRTAATRSPQRPIEFELDLDDDARDRAKKPTS